MSAPLRLRPYLFWLLALLLLPTALGLVGIVPNDVRIESRREPIGIESDRFLDEDYYAAIDRELSEQFPGRGAGQWLQVMVDYELFGDVVADTVVRGPGDWLHRREGVNPSCATLAAIAAPDGREPVPDVLFVVTATKSHIVPESVYPGTTEACVEVERAGWRERTRAAVDHADVNDALEAAEASGTATFLKQDGHWTQQGRLVVAEQLVEALRPGLWATAEIREIPPVVRDMDVLRSMGLRRDGVLRDRAVVVDGEQSVDVVNSVESQSAYFPLAQVSTSSASETIEGTTWLVGDSQAGYLLYELEPFFEELVFVNWLQWVLDPSQIEGLPDPDRVVFTGVEPNAAGLFASPSAQEVIDRVNGEG